MALCGSQTRWCCCQITRQALHPQLQSRGQWWWTVLRALRCRKARTCPSRWPSMHADRVGAALMLSLLRLRDNWARYLMGIREPLRGLTSSSMTHANGCFSRGIGGQPVRPSTSGGCMMRKPRPLGLLCSGSSSIYGQRRRAYEAKYIRPRPPLRRPSSMVISNGTFITLL